MEKIWVFKFDDPQFALRDGHKLNAAGMCLLCSEGLYKGKKPTYVHRCDKGEWIEVYRENLDKHQVCEIEDNVPIWPEDQTP